MEMQVDVATRGELTVVELVSSPEPADAAQAWLVDAVAQLLVAVRACVAAPSARPRRLALLLRAPSGRTPEERATAAGLAAALRGIAQSLALELAPATCVNAVLCDASADAEATLALLADPDGGFVTGAAIDLRSAA